MKKLKKERKQPALSVLHIKILRWIWGKKKTATSLVTPDDLARAWWGNEVRHNHQQWAYLQLTRLQDKGLVKKPQRGRYQITATGVKKLKPAA